MGNMYNTYKADEKSEQEGILLEYDETFRVRVRRQGGANKKFEKLLDRKTSRIKKALELDAVSNEKQKQILMEVVAESIVINWEVADGEDDQGNTKWVQGIEGPNGERLEFNYDNVLLTFRNLPDLFLSINRDSAKPSLFRKALQEENSKN